MLQNAPECSMLLGLTPSSLLYSILVNYNHHRPLGNVAFGFSIVSLSNACPDAFVGLRLSP